MSVPQKQMVLRRVIPGAVETFRDSHVHLPGAESACPIGAVIDVFLLQDSLLEVCPPRNLPHQLTWTAGQVRWTSQ